MALLIPSTNVDRRRDSGLYPRPAVEIEGAVTATSRDNFRNPRLICDFINTLSLADLPVHKGASCLSA